MPLTVFPASRNLRSGIQSMWRHLLMGCAVFAIALLGLAIPTSPAQAAKYAAIVIEESTGKVLFSRNANSMRKAQKR